MFLFFEKYLEEFLKAVFASISGGGHKQSMIDFVMEYLVKLQEETVHLFQRNPRKAS